MTATRVPNYWTDFEYNKLKLLNNIPKASSIIRVLDKLDEFDSTPPISLELHLTDNCNLNCPWCTDGILRKNLASLKKEKVMSLFDYCAKNNVGVTVEGGGEPTMHKDFIELIDYASSKNIHLGLITNGVRDISKIGNKFKWIRVSIDASNSDEYKLEKGFDRFNKVLGNLEKLCEHRDPKETFVGVGYVLTTRNQGELIELIGKLDKIGVDYIYIRPVEESPDITPDIDNLLNLKRKLIQLEKEGVRIRYILSQAERLVVDNDNLPCVAHSLTCVVQANGDVALCEKRRHDKITYGNINTEDFGSIWNSEYRRNISKKLVQSSEQKGCATCRITSFNRIFYDLKTMNTKHFI